MNCLNIEHLRDNNFNIDAQEILDLNYIANKFHKVKIINNNANIKLLYRQSNEVEQLMKETLALHIVEPYFDLILHFLNKNSYECLGCDLKFNTRKRLFYLCNFENTNKIN